MSNFLRGMGSVFNLFPETDYMAMVPKEGELLELSARDVRECFGLAFEQQAQLVDGGAYLKKSQRGREKQATR